MTSFLAILLVLNLLAYVGQTLMGVLHSDDGHLLVALGHLSVACLLIFPVFTRRRVSAFEPFSLFLLYIHIGTLAASYVIAFGSGRRRDVLMHGDPVEFFLSAGVVLALAMLIVGLGYSVCQRRLPAERMIPSDDRFHAGGLHLVALIVFLVAVAATLQFVQSTGGFSFEALSRKRAIEIKSEGQIVFGNAGYLRLAAGLSMTMLYVMFANYLKSPYKMRLPAKLVVVALLITGVALPFLSSSRGTVIYAFLGLVLIYTLYRPLNLRFVLSVTLTALVLFSLMTSLRNVAQRGENVSAINPIRALAESGNGLSLNGTAHILDGVPDRMAFKLGASYLTWITAPVPRRFWPAKPDVSMGKEIKAKIFEETVLRSGRPPSVFSEGYINFGWIGFFFTAFAFGYLCRLIANSFLLILNTGVFAVALYFPFYLHFATLANAATSQIVVRILSDVIPVYLIFFGAMFFSARRRRSAGIA